VPTGLAHAAVCVPDVDAVVRWYESVLALRMHPYWRQFGS
jgi:catechol 2,3-dioxygenase-like lactoylglutathione lyase family enzyme